VSARSLPLLAVPALAAAALACGGGGLSAGSDRWASVVREDFRVVVPATGRLKAAVSHEMGPPSVRDVWNYNLKWMIREGARVRPGDVVLRFDTTDLDEKLLQYETSLETTRQEREKEQRNLEIELRRLQLDLVKAEGELRMSDVELSVPEGLVASIELERLRLSRQLAQTRVEHLREKIRFEKDLVASKLALLDVKTRRWEQLIEQTRKAKDSFSIRAPIEGVVIYVPKRGGDRWEVGERVWMLAKVLEVADTSSLRVEAEVLEVDAARVKPGQAATVSVDAVPGSLLRSEVVEVGRLVRERSVQDPSKVFDAWLPLADIDEEVMRPGMSVQAQIEVEVLPDRLVVPVQAVEVTQAGPTVRVSGPAGAERRPVVLGPHSGGRVVVESGLAEGERVLLGGSPGERA
jgi:HlyD family secretion protein